MAVRSGVVVPSHEQFWWPTLVAIRDRGGSASIAEIEEGVVSVAGLTSDQQAVVHGGGPQTEASYRMAWARTYLKGMGLLINSERAVWSLTEAGQRFLERAEPLTLAERQAQLNRLADEYRKRNRSLRKARPAQAGDVPDDDATVDWKEQLLDAVLAMPPAGFERLSQRLLREEGFINARVTGRTGDGGIDGVGVYQLSLVSFPVFFQSKRYRGSVGAGAVRDFRGAMAGRGEKGLLITTGTFTADARQEATRDGAPPVDLIDGDRLCDLLRRHSLGVRTTVRTVEDISVEGSFFLDL